MNDLTVPVELQSIIGAESIDFLVKARRKQPVKNSFGVILFGTVWSAFVSIFVVVLFGPLI